MSYTNYIKAEHTSLSIQEILRSRPNVLLGVNDEANALMELMKIQSVFDLSLSVIFTNATRILNNRTDLSSSIRKHGTAPSSMVDKDQLSNLKVANLPLEGVKALIGIGTSIADSMKEQLSISTIRDLALWPPYLAAKSIVQEAYGISAIDTSDPEAPAPSEVFRIQTDSLQLHCWTLRTQ